MLRVIHLCLVPATRQAMRDVARRDASARDKTGKWTEVVCCDRADEEETRHAGLIGGVEQWQRTRTTHLFAHDWIDEGEPVNVGPVAGAREEMVDHSCRSVGKRQLQFIAVWSSLCHLCACRN